MTIPITEITAFDPERVDAVGEGANGFPVLLMKSLADADPQYRESIAMAGQDDYDIDDDDMEKASCGDELCPICVGRLAKGKLDAADRKALSPSSFVFPKKRAYPIHDRSHAANALSRVSANGSPKEKAAVRAAVRAKYPDMGKGGKKGMKGVGTQGGNEAKARRAPRGEATSQTPTAHEGRETGAVSFENQRPEGKVDVNAKNNLATAIPNPSRSTAPPSGDLSPDQALSQTRGRMRKSESEGAEGDPAKDVPLTGDDSPEKNDSRAKRETVSQTKSRMRKGKRKVNPKRKGKLKLLEADNRAAKARPTATEDPAIGEAASNLLEYAVKLLGQQDVPEGSAVKALDLTTLQSEQALGHARELVAGLTRNLRHNEIAAKELDDMNAAELAAFLDERDSKIVKSLSKKLKKAKADKKALKKSAKKKGKAVKGASYAGPEPLVDTAEITRKITEATGQAVKAAVEPLEDTVNRMAKERANPRPRPALNERADPQAVLRDQAVKGSGDDTADPTLNGNALKSLEERFEKSTDPEERAKLGRELTTAKLTIAERQRWGNR